MERVVTAGAEGRIIIDAELSRLAGAIELNADKDCQRAELVISTDEEAGPAADAVGNAVVEWRDGRLSVTVSGSEAAGGPVTITGTVPPGCTLEAATTSAAITTDGVTEVDARTESGNVTVNNAEHLRARLKGGDLTVGEATTVDARLKGSGDLTIGHARHIDARTEAGAISVERSDGDTWVSTQGGAIDIKNFEYGTVVAGTKNDGAITVNATGGGSIQADTEVGAIAVNADTPETAAALRVTATSRNPNQVNVPGESVRSSPELPATSGAGRSLDGRQAPSRGTDLTR
ncbi:MULTISPECIES: DUF4097 family beta strand repeat-containing protein [unclassified Kribbella]|uniref:DUF4097 family beta strand repeat-containing protein n=1 Tax=unclassified Kribbella TaxID=2644121 RepID=UPI003017661D